MFINLVSNACGAMAERASREKGAYQPVLRLKTRRTEDAVLVTIRDNGTGMTPEVMEKMFNPFFTTKEANRGTGLGLSLSHDIIREHGGTITPESKPGEYTEMKISLPLRRE